MGGSFVFVTDALQHSATNALPYVYALQHCHEKSASVFFCRFRVLSLFLFFVPGCSSGDLLWFHIQETQVPFHSGERYGSLLCSTAQLHIWLEVSMDRTYGFRSSGNGNNYQARW